MKAKMAILLTAIMLLCASACAQEGYIGSMKVVNCKEWVSLRELPDAASSCLIEVPLGALVENCREESDAFHYGEYSGMGGYIMAQYLEVIPVEQTYLGKLRVVNGGEWTPMYADTTQNAVVVQWMAPGELIEDAREASEGFIYGTCRGMEGYVASHQTAQMENTSDEGKK